MTIYGIPPLLSAIVLFTLFLMGIFKAKKSSINLLFALIALLGALLNVDKMILTITSDPSLALRLCRIDHSLLVFVIPLYLHFTVMATGYRKWLPLVKILYLVALILVPITQHPLYFTGVKHYSFGYFSLAGPLFNIFCVFSGVSVACSFFLLAKGLREERVSVRRTRIKYILLGFGLASFVSHLDIVVLMGYELYPPGNFAFIPLCLLGYAIYRHDVMEWKIFLNKGILFLALLLTSTGFFVGVSVLLRNLFQETLHRDLIYGSSMVSTFLLIYVSRERLGDLLTRFLHQEFARNRRTIRDLSLKILTLREGEEIANTVTGQLAATFQLAKCDIRREVHLEEGEDARFPGESDSLWSQGYRLSIPVRAEAHPSRLLLGEKGDMSLFTAEEVELLSILGNHVALALDNATAYRRIRDFSESLERLVEERTKALIQSESLAAVGRLAAGVAHELNNPIASVMSTIEYQSDHSGDNEDLREDLTFALGELKRARDIVRSLLDASRQRDEAKEIVDVHKPIRDASKVLHNQYINKGIALTADLRATSSLIKGNQARLCQVFINVIKNAIDAIGDETGTIRVETENAGCSQRGESQVIVKITDTGAGIEPQKIKDVFKPFFTTKPPGKGIGLGLYIVHEIVKDHSGTVTVESKVGEGTTITLALPGLPQ